MLLISKGRGFHSRVFQPGNPTHTRTRRSWGGKAGASWNPRTWVVCMLDKLHALRPLHSCPVSSTHLSWWSPEADMGQFGLRLPFAKQNF